MKITFKKENGWWPWQRRNLAERVAHHATHMAELIPANAHRDFFYDIRLKVIFTKFKNAYGDAYGFEDDPTSYEIRLSSTASDKRLVQTIYHEMCHIKQFYFEGLELGDKPVWKGETFSNTEYWNAPWEVEARKFEKKCWRIWKKSLDFEGRF